MAIFENGVRIKSTKAQKEDTSKLFKQIEELGVLQEQNKWLLGIIKQLLKKFTEEEAQELLGEEILNKVFPQKKKEVETTFRKV